MLLWEQNDLGGSKMSPSPKPGCTDFLARPSYSTTTSQAELQAPVPGALLRRGLGNTISSHLRKSLREKGWNYPTTSPVSAGWR